MPPSSSRSRDESKVGRDSLHALAAKMLVQVGTMAVSVVGARCLGPKDTGVLAVLMTLLQSPALAGRVGQPTANIYLLARRKGDPRVAVNAVVFPVVTGLVLALGLALFRDAVSSAFLDRADPILVLILVWLLPFRFLEDNLYSLL